MQTNDRPSLRVLVFSSGNPDATLLTVGLLRNRPDKVGMVIVQGVEDLNPVPGVVRTLKEIGLDLVSWSSDIVRGPVSEPVDVGLTICIPT